jgi:hypothetical protein
VRLEEIIVRGLLAKFDYRLKLHINERQQNRSGLLGADK